MDIDYHVGDVYTVNQVRVANYTESYLSALSVNLMVGEDSYDIDIPTKVIPPGLISVVELQKGGVELIPQTPANLNSRFSMTLRCYDCLMMNGYPLAWNWSPSIDIPAFCNQ